MVDPSHLWLQIVGPKATQLDLLVEEMTEYYSKKENREAHVLSIIQVGDLVASKFKYDQKWYVIYLVVCTENNIFCSLGIERKY